VLTNRDSPDKRPKAEEEEGRNSIIDRLDDLYRIFEQRAVEGRSKNVKGFSAETVRSLAGRTVTAEKALELGLIDGILSEKAGGISTNTTRGVNTMKLADFLAANPGAGEEIASYAEKELGMLPKAETDRVKTALAEARTGVADREAAVQSDRERVLELLDLSGVQLSDSLRAAVRDGADSGEYAKGRVKELNAALGASNTGSLGSPKSEQRLTDQIVPKHTSSKDAVTDEDRLRDMAKKGGF
jgi:hypothetical protein